MENSDALACLGSLAQETRLSVFRRLVRTGSAGLPAGALSDQLDVPATSLSFHLHSLLQAGLVSQTRHGRQLIYAANYPRMDALVAYLTENCCGLVSRRATANPRRDTPRRTA